MKTLLLSGFLLLSLTTHAQRKPKLPLAPVPVVYCELVAAEGYTSRSFSLDYGQDQPSSAQDNSLDAANRYVQQLNSAPAALNYLYSVGWEPVSVSNASVDVSSSGTIRSTTRYLLHRRP